MPSRSEPASRARRVSSKDPLDDKSSHPCSGSQVEKAPSPPHEFAEPSPIRSAGTFFPPKQCGSLRGKTRFSHWAREVPAAGACLRGSCFGCGARLRGGGYRVLPPEKRI